MIKINIITFFFFSDVDVLFKLELNFLLVYSKLYVFSYPFKLIWDSAKT